MPKFSRRSAKSQPWIIYGYSSAAFWVRAWNKGFGIKYRKSSAVLVAIIITPI